MKKINPNQISSITFKGIEICDNVKYKQRKTLFGITIQRGGWYIRSTSDWHFIKKEQLNEKSIFITDDNIAYLYPSIVIHMNNGVKYTLDVLTEERDEIAIYKIQEDYCKRVIPDYEKFITL